MSQAPPQNLSFAEKLAYGCGNFFPTLVTSTAGMAMFFYTDVAGLSAALIGTVLLLVRLADAGWDVYVGRWVDRNRSRWGQCRPFLLFAAPLMVVALLAAFTVPPVDGPGAKLAWVVLSYSALWWGYSLVMIPFQSLPPVMTPDPDARLRLLGVSTFVLFIFVVGCGAGFPVMKDVLAAGNPAQGFQRAALLFGGVGLVMTWLCFALVKERVQAPPAKAPDIKADFAALWASRAWRACMVAFGLLALLIGLPLAAGAYYFAAVLKAPALIGPFMGLSGLGLMAGVVLSDRLTRHFCKKRVMVVSSALMGVVSLGYLATMSGPPPAVFALAFLANLMLGVGAPVSQSLLADAADAIERDTGRRVVGTLFATVGFAQKIGAGLSSAVVGAMLSATGYVASTTGPVDQPAGAVWGIAALMGPVTGVFAFLIAAVLGWGYPMGRAELARLRDDLAARRAAAAAPVAS